MDVERARFDPTGKNKHQMTLYTSEEAKGLKKFTQDTVVSAEQTAKNIGEVAMSLSKRSKELSKELKHITFGPTNNNNTEGSTAVHQPKSSGFDSFRLRL